MALDVFSTTSHVDTHTPLVPNRCTRAIPMEVYVCVSAFEAKAQPVDKDNGSSWSCGGTPVDWQRVMARRLAGASLLPPPTSRARKHVTNQHAAIATQVGVSYPSRSKYNLLTKNMSRHGAVMARPQTGRGLWPVGSQVPLCFRHHHFE